MSDDVMASLPVTPEAAELLRDTERARRMGKLVSDLLRPATPETDPLAVLIAEVKADARAAGLTDEEIDAEMAAYNAERRL
jgi:hypothetical protein